MLKIKVNSKFNYEVESDNGDLTVNGRAIDTDLVRIDNRTFHIIHEGKSFNAELVSINRDDKTCAVKVGTNIYFMQITDQYDDLLHQLGMDNIKTNKISEIKAPMPGLVLRILASEGNQVEKGGNLFVLEAMKMENIIKAVSDVKIKTVKVKAGDKVEKNQVVMVFE
ncbi:MAG: acetyl-CoA carboxylase biotin carboxyl carrier protein subunit [Sphingobacterium thalpophilum]|jgi:acetyl/propionyl-CoA carboxylase alpha subunit